MKKLALVFIFLLLLNGVASAALINGTYNMVNGTWSQNWTTTPNSGVVSATLENGPSTIFIEGSFQATSDRTIISPISYIGDIAYENSYRTYEGIGTITEDANTYNFNYDVEMWYTPSWNRFTGVYLGVMGPLHGITTGTASDGIDNFLITSDYLMIETYFNSEGHGGTLTGNTNVVPIPAAIWLLGSGLLGIIGIRRKSGK